MSAKSTGSPTVGNWAGRRGWSIKHPRAPYSSAIRPRQPCLNHNRFDRRCSSPDTSLTGSRRPSPPASTRSSSTSKTLCPTTRRRRHVDSFARALRRFKPMPPLLSTRCARSGSTDWSLVRPSTTWKASCVPRSMRSFSPRWSRSRTWRNSTRSHVAIVNEVFNPSQDEIAHAQGLLGAMAEAERDGSAATIFEGDLVDYAMVSTARELLPLPRCEGRRRCGGAGG